MHPIIHIGPFTFYSYGLMLAIAFSAAAFFFMQEVKRKGVDRSVAVAITFISCGMGVLGASLLSLLEHWVTSFRDPQWKGVFSAGMTFYGGFILALLLNILYLRYRKIRFFFVADCAAPSLMIAYALARIGCQFSGDGDYGFPTTLPWGTDYSQGTYPPSLAFRNIPEIASQYPGGIVPDSTLCNPTPVYEFLACAALFWVLWKIRKNIQPEGKLFMLYLIFSGLERFFIEFFRISPRIAIGLTEAQIISVVLVLVGMVGWYLLSSRPAQLGPASG